MEADLGEGQMVRWQYGGGHEMSETLSQDGKPILTRSISQDGMTDTTVLTDGPTYEVRKDDTGYPSMLSIDGVKAATISWQKDGTLAGLHTSNTEIRPRRHQDGWPNGVLISAPMISEKTNEWIKEEWDVMGRLIKITDSSGFEYKMVYDDQGRLLTFGETTEDKKIMGSRFLYDDDGLVTGIDSSWEKEKREYENNGILKNIKIERQGTKSVTTYDHDGLQINHLAFDGGTTTWRYDSKNTVAVPGMIELPDGKQINYKYEHSNKTRNTEISLDSTTVYTAFDAKGRVTTLTWGQSNKY